MVCQPHFYFQDHESEIKAIYGGNEFFQSASGDFKVGIILESTSFYAEQGGQVKSVLSVIFSYL